jgi:hypothetical protein
VFEQLFEVCKQLCGASIIKPPFAFLQEQIEVFTGHAIEFSQVPFSLIPKILDAINMVVIGSKKLAMIDTIMLKLRNIERVISAEAIGVDDAVWLYFLADNMPPRFEMPKTATLPAAPLPRLPLRVPPK